MKIILPVITALLAGAAVFFIVRPHQKPSVETTACSEALLCGQEVSLRLHQMSDDIGARLSAFAAEVALDQMFSLRLLAEDNRSAPEVSAKAGQFIKPMGFSVLTIIDSASLILSSGDFPASTGNSVAKKAALLADQPKFIIDHIMGKDVVTLQAKKAVRIVDSIPFYALGGIAIDEAVLSGLSPREGVTVLLKQGSTITGMPGIKTITAIKDNKIVINDTEYGASQINLPFIGDGEPPVLIVIAKPAVTAAGNR